ncbi:MAG: aminoacyl-tRNA hydrolase [Candidatus Omnitrophica bacterium]|nr:aminoacyl-tRNA hydrolase [Candidatus Omnitrophota bacterium]MDE2215047.1 aminoacyl-tRNA hydrolase [Candidatus Omnitrophota bacterium]
MAKLIVGLGNPELKYKWTRHNLGFLALEELNRRHKLNWVSSASKHGSYAKLKIGDVDCYFLMPTTYMNNSGLAVKAAAERSGSGPEDVLVICDDLDLPFGKMRLRPSGSAGGHNGLKSIIEHMGTDRFSRLRLGIDSPQTAGTVDYVLSNFTPAEKKQLPDFINHALDCVTCWVTEGAKAAMNRFN